MVAKRQTADDLHGNVPDSATCVLLLIDVINDLDFPENDSLLEEAPALAKRIAQLKSRCEKVAIPCIYVNDNRDRWRSDFRHVLKRCMAKRSPGRQFVKQLLPAQEDYFILKPKHSAFFSTPLETILTYMKVKNVILAGLTTGSCVLGTATELHVRDFKIFVPSDCSYALSQSEHTRALQVIESSFGASIGPSTELILRKGDVKVKSKKPRD